MPISTLFIDLDDTVYPAESGVWKAIGQRIDLFVAEKFSLGREEAYERRQQLFFRYGTTMRGLQAEYAIDEDEYLAFVHDIPLNQYLAPDPNLARVLHRYPQRKLIFTNADVAHARRVLAVLGISDCFDDIVDIKRMHPYCKPMPGAFQIALETAGSPLPEECALFDDHAGNIRAARALGMSAIRVGALQPDPEASATIARLADLLSVLPLDGVE
jgi:pyrimidine 5'-nucleotidase